MIRQSYRSFLLAFGATLVFTVSASGDRPLAIPFTVTFDDVNPCSGLVHTITIQGTTFVHSHDGRVVAVSERTITTTPTGFVGHGRDAEVVNDNVAMFRLADVITSEATGERIRAKVTQVVDLRTGTTRAFKGDVLCVGN